MTEPTLRSVADLRRALGVTVEACDQGLHGHAWDSTQALRRLPALLARVTVRAERVRWAVEQEGLS
jgi:hypothetical protein